MKKYRQWLIVFSAIVIVGQLILIDYQNLNGSSNVGNYLGIVSMICVITSMMLINHQENKAER